VICPSGCWRELAVAERLRDRNEIGAAILIPCLESLEALMKQDPFDEHAADEQLPTEPERNYGTLTAGVIALVVIGTAIYWIA
jgi:hypothetical protein